MAKWANETVLDGGLTFLKNNATRMILIKAYAAEDISVTIASGGVTLIMGSMVSAPYILPAGVQIGHNSALTTLKLIGS